MRIKRALVLFHFLAVMLLLLPAIAFSGEITVRHGNFDHFNISIPEQITAGAEAQIKLSAADSLNNAVLNTGDTKRQFTVSVTGSAAVKPQAFELSSFLEGTFTITLTDKTAETVILSLTEKDNPIPVLTREFNVLPDKLTSLYVKGPRNVTAGEQFEVRITEKDSFGNTTAEPLFGRNLSVSFNGNTEPSLAMSSVSDFKNGTGTIGFIAEKTGNVAIEVKDMATGSMGTSERINIKSGPLHSFRLISLRELIAGEPFELSIFPVDRFGNVIPGYSSSGRGVSITSSGKQKPFPATVSASEFVNGQAKVELRYDGAETVRIKITELDGRQTGESGDVVFQASTPERFEVITPDSVIAGHKFKIKIAAYNQVARIIRNYNLSGTDVLLSTTGTGNLTPNRIPPSEFVNGIAIIDAQYNKAESFDITASAEKPRKAAKAESEGGVAVADIKEQSNSKEKSMTEAVGEEEIAEISDISLDEGNGKATVAIRVENAAKGWKYKVDTMTKDGKKWILIKMQPVVNKVKLKLIHGSLFVNNIVVEKDKKEKNSELVKIELIKPIRYRISKINNNINIELKK